MARKGSPCFVAIVGGSGAGKTRLADALHAALGRNAARISLDDFYRDRSHLPVGRRARINFDHPRAIDWAAVERAFAQCAAGRPARLPAYDFKTHSRLDRNRILKPKPVILADGLWLLRRPSLRRLFHLRIFIDCPSKTRWHRRLARDLAVRGRTRAAVKRQFWETVEPMHRRFVQPQKNWADVILNPAFGGREVGELARRVRDLAARPEGPFQPLPPGRSGRSPERLRSANEIID